MKYFIYVVILVTGFTILGYILFFSKNLKRPTNKEPKNQETISKMKLTSSAFLNNQKIPAKYTCDGDNINPPFSISDIPFGAKSLVIIVDDPDAPSGIWTHWVLWNIKPQTEDIAEGQVPEGAREGTNDFGKTSYGGPCPPSGSHRYQFKIYALDEMLNLDTSVKKNDLEKATHNHVIGEALLVGLYSRD